MNGYSVDYQNQLEIPDSDFNLFTHKQLQCLPLPLSSKATTHHAYTMDKLTSQTTKESASAKSLTKGVVLDKDGKP